jgi:uncharacterized protein (DUF1015 family)
MAEILPFIGTRFNSQLIGNLSNVLAPPYDVITPEQQEELYQRHQYNVIRLELPREKPGDDAFTNRYSRAANTFRTWRSDGILIEDEQPSIYLYEQEFKLPDGETRKRSGFFALVKIEDYRSGEIKAHEYTFEGPKADRLNLMRATHANFSPIFVIYNDPQATVTELLTTKTKERAWEEVVDDDGTIHRLWVVHKKEFLQKLHDTMKERKLFIADGHHRYETALNFRNEMRQETRKADGRQPFDYMMMYLTSAEQEGLVILPTHRVLTRDVMAEVNLSDAMDELKDSFTIIDDKIDLEKPEQEGKRLTTRLEKLGAERTSFALLLPNGKAHFLQLKPKVVPKDMIDDEELHDAVKELDVSILHNYVINQVFIGNPEFELDDDDCYYVRDVSRVFKLLGSKKGAAAFLMNATPMEQVVKIVSAGIKMPHKSTYFHPKIITGLVIRNMDCEKARNHRR